MLPLAEPVAKRVGGKRPGDDIALGDIAAEIAQQLELGRGLDSLGGDLQAEPVRHRDDAFDDHRAVARGRHVIDEESVNLELGERQLAQLHQA